MESWEAAGGEQGVATRQGETGDIEIPGLDRRAGWIWAFGWPAVLLLLFSISTAVDLAADLANGVTGVHVIIETLTLASAIVAVAFATWHLRAAVRRSSDLQRDLQQTRADLDRWRAESQALMRGLGSALAQQFLRWGLTAAESEIALLILKGLSYKEIANARGTTERTVRHQALAIYRKAGFAGRAELAAFFLHDLLLPSRQPAQSPEPAAAPTPAPRARA